MPAGVGPDDPQRSLPIRTISCDSVIVSYPPLYITVKGLLNTLPTDTREAALRSPEANSSPDLLSPAPSASPHTESAPAPDDLGGPAMNSL